MLDWYHPFRVEPGINALRMCSSDQVTVLIHDFNESQVEINYLLNEIVLKVNFGNESWQKLDLHCSD